MKVYLDTNILFGIVKKQIESKIIEEREKELNFPFEAVTSSFTLLELAKVLKRELRLSWNASEKIVENFSRELEILEEAKISKNFFKLLKNKISAEDLLHLSFSLSNNIPILTNDKELISIARNLKIEAFSLKELKIVPIKNKL